MRTKAKKFFFKKLFKGECELRDFAREQDLDCCSGQLTPEERRKEGCEFCTIFIPNVENWSKKEYPKC